MRSYVTLVLMTMAIACAAQDVKTRSSDFTVNTNTSDTDLPLIKWIAPSKDFTYQSDTIYNVKLDLTGATPIKIIQISLKDDIKSKPRISQKIELDLARNANSMLEFEVDLETGMNVIEVVAENAAGAIASSHKIIQVGNASLQDVRKLERVDHALIFATDQYDNWPDLANPIFDGRAIGDELKNTYGFEVEVVENPTQNDVLKKIREYIAKQYTPFDQLFIFFAGHGTFDQMFNEGYLVPRDAQIIDEGKTSYLSYHRLRSLVNVIPCEHIYLAIDVCFGGTFVEENDVEDSVQVITDPSTETVTKKLTYKTRKFITSGEKQYVSDGQPGRHSPFTRELLEALRSFGGDDGILTLPEIMPYVSKLKIKPRVGEFGDDVAGSDFIFVSR